ncbi:MAG: hypothetical protein PHZ02_03420 [Desulfocapsaceae bacterium]|nr:hypothetical protein [Desulfocapsaceae bacterium]
MTENSIRQEQIESFGRLMAGFSHDMKNHLGIIRESNGLMGDIVAMNVLGEDETTIERLKKTIASIERRVCIAAIMLQHLSGLAHRSDTPCSSFLVNDLLTEECTFLERFARLKQVKQVVEPGEDLPSVYNDPSLLQHIIYRVYLLCLEQLKPNQSLVIITGRNGKNVTITFRLNGGSQGNLEEVSFNNLLPAIEKLEGTLKQGGENHNDITLTIPSLSVAEK